MIIKRNAPGSANPEASKNQSAIDENNIIPSDHAQGKPASQKFKWHQAIASDRHLPPIAVSLAIKLANHFDKSLQCYVGVENCAVFLGCDERTVRRGIKALEARGYLVIKPRASCRRTNLYTMTFRPSDRTPMSGLNDGLKIVRPDISAHPDRVRMSAPDRTPVSGKPIKGNTVRITRKNPAGSEATERDKKNSTIQHVGTVSAQQTDRREAERFFTSGEEIRSDISSSPSTTPLSLISTSDCAQTIKIEPVTEKPPKAPQDAEITQIDPDDLEFLTSNFSPKEAYQRALRTLLIGERRKAFLLASENSLLPKDHFLAEAKDWVDGIARVRPEFVHHEQRECAETYADLRKMGVDRRLIRTLCQILYEDYPAANLLWVLQKIQKSVNDLATQQRRDVWFDIRAAVGAGHAFKQGSIGRKEMISREMDILIEGISSVFPVVRSDALEFAYAAVRSIRYGRKDQNPSFGFAADLARGAVHIDPMKDPTQAIIDVFNDVARRFGSESAETAAQESGSVAPISSENAA